MKLSLLIICVCVSLQTFSQNYSLEIIDSYGSKKDKIKYEKFHNDSLSVYLELNIIKNKYYENGYITATYDSILFDSLQVTAYFSKGKQFFWSNVNFINIAQHDLRKIGIKQKYFTARPINFTKLELYNEKILTYYENSGYPFASIKFDTVFFEEEKLYCNISLNKNKLIKIDSIIIKGEVKLMNYYIEKYIDISKGDIYNEQKIRKIENLLNNNEFLQQSRSPQVEFHENTADIYLYLKNRKANRFSGIVGFVPNNDNGKLQFTGEVDLKLLNSIKRGEYLQFQWEKLKPATQKLDLEVNFPFIFKTPFGISENFSLYKEDSTYINLQNNIGLQYFYAGVNYIKLLVWNKNSYVLREEPTLNLQNIRTILYGLAFYNSQFDYKYNPHKGFSFFSQTAYGNRTVADSAKSKQIEAIFKLEFYFPIYKNFVCKLQNYTSLIHNKTALYDNELLKIGGLKTMRGFDEESLSASFFSINTIELRYLFDENSNVYLFSDIAYYQNKTDVNNFEDLPLSFGLGINFSTKVGIFSLNYAVGKQLDNPFLLKTAKIHFGFISIF